MGSNWKQGEKMRANSGVPNNRLVGGLEQSWGTGPGEDTTAGMGEGRRPDGGEYTSHDLEFGGNEFGGNCGTARS